MPLPARDPHREDDWVASFGDDPDPDALIAAIEDCLRERRPRLAARIVALLPDDVAAEPGSPVDRARRAAALWIADQDDGEAFDAWADAFAEFRRRRMRRWRGRYWVRRDPRPR